MLVLERAYVFVGVFKVLRTCLCVCVSKVLRTCLCVCFFKVMRTYVSVRCTCLCVCLVTKVLGLACVGSKRVIALSHPHTPTTHTYTQTRVRSLWTSLILRWNWVTRNQIQLKVLSRLDSADNCTCLINDIRKSCYLYVIHVLASLTVSVTSVHTKLSLIKVSFYHLRLLRV